MTSIQNQPKAPSLQDLTLRYLERLTIAEVGEILDPHGEVELLSVSAGIPVEPRTAWLEAQSALSFPKPPSKVTTPPEWANWVHTAGQDTAIPFAAGNFPQDVQDLAPLVEASPLSRLRPSGVDRGAVSRATQSWVDQRVKTGNVGEIILAAGVLRRIGSLKASAEVLDQAKSVAGNEHRTVLANEEAALLWQQGKANEALRAWESMGDSTISLFNRGMALLFLDQAANARIVLRKATEQLPESSAWHHLAGLYAALAEMRK